MATCTQYLQDHWTLYRADKPAECYPAHIPIDVHHLLLEAGALPDPFYRDNEAQVQWVHQHSWVLERHFDLTEADLAETLTLELEFLDTHTDITLNDQPVTSLCNFFRRYHLDIGSQAQLGSNCLRITLHDVAKLASERAEALPFPVPYSESNNTIPHMNTVRKTQCDTN